MSSIDSPLDPAAVIAECERSAQRFETPCGDGTLVWRRWGNGGPPVLLAHGSHGSWAHWIRNLEALASRHTVWAIDLPGWGDSAMPPAQDHRTVADVIAAGLRALPIDVPLDVAGFSLGGVICAHVAALHPQLVRRLILIGTGGLDTPLGHINMQRLRGLDERGRRAVLRANLLELMLHDPASADELAVQIQATFALKNRFDAGAFVLPDKLLQALPKIAAQVHAIWGEHDCPHPNPAVQEQVLRRFHPHMQFRVIRDAGHWVMYERPAETNQALLELLAWPLAH